MPMPWYAFISLQAHKKIKVSYGENDLAA